MTRTNAFVLCLLMTSAAACGKKAPPATSAQEAPTQGTPVVQQVVAGIPSEANIEAAKRAAALATQNVTTMEKADKSADAQAGQ